jgi:hypothetical protein
MTYLPRNFCKSDGCRPFGKFEWDPTITDSSIFLLLCKLLLRAFSSMRMFSSMLFLLCFYVRIPKGFYPSYPAISVLPSKTTIINTHSLLVQYLPTISPFGIDGNTCIQHSDFNSPLHSTIQTLLCYRNILNSTPFSPFDINVKEDTFFH